MIGFFGFVFKNFFEMDIQKREVERINKELEYKHNILVETILDINELVITLSHADPKNYPELFKYSMQSNEDIVQMKFLNPQGTELIRYNRMSKNIVRAPASQLQNMIIQGCCKEIRALQVGELWHSPVDILKENSEVVRPITFVLRFVIKTNKGFVALILDINELFEKVHQIGTTNSYILDKDGNFLLHSNPKYNWSKYFSPTKTIFKLFPRETKNILDNDYFVSEHFVSKRVYITYKDYVVLLTTFNKTEIMNYFKEFESYFITIFVLGVIVAIILSLVFSEPLAKLNRKTEEVNKDLDMSIKKSHEALNESQNIIDKYVMSIRMDKDGIITDVSNAFCDVSGFSKEELIGHHHKVLVHSDMSNKEYEAIWKPLKKGKSNTLELKALKKDGGYYWTESYIDPIFDSEGEIIGYTAIRNNITDKKVIENLYSDINYQVQQYNAIFENAHSGIGLIDLLGNFKKVNFMFSKLLGHTSSELLNMSCFDIVVPNSINFFRKLFVEAQEIGAIANIEKVFLHKDGSEIHLQMSLNLLPDKKHFVLVVNSLQDKRKLQELNQNLEIKIQQEVEKSRQKDKIHQEEQIRNIKLTSIGTLAAGITHEINTPLTYIKGNFEMMGYDIEDLPDGEIKTRMLEDSERIKDGINRIANIVESMREISQSSNESKENVNIYSTIITALTMTYNRSKQISRIYLNDKLFEIDSINKNEFEFMCKVQKQRVEQVWIVIVNNALDELANVEDYEQRELKIYIEEQKDDVVVRFEDNAGGIKEEMIARLFDPFVSSKEHSGMGVGLNISKKIIEQQNGEITAYNKNSGAVFEVRLQKCE